jgi:hypothetical protein
LEESHRKLKEPAMKFRPCFSPQTKSAKANELVSFLTVEGKAIPQQVEAYSTDTGIYEVLQDDALGVFGAHRAH